MSNKKFVGIAKFSNKSCPGDIPLEKIQESNSAKTRVIISCKNLFWMKEKTDCDQNSGRDWLRVTENFSKV